MHHSARRVAVTAFVLSLFLSVTVLAGPLAGTGAVATPQVQDIQDPAYQDSMRAEHEIGTLPGFEVQLIYEVPLEEQGSWMALEALPN